ncbi:hypothetical protein [Kitasatospora griseola]
MINAGLLADQVRTSNAEQLCAEGAEKPAHLQEEIPVLAGH